MGYILKSDYRSIANDIDLGVLSDENDRILEQCNRIATDEAKGYIAQKYNVDDIFSEPKLFDDTIPYNIGDRIYIIESGETYHYSCDVSGVTGETINNTAYYSEGDTRDNKLLEVVMSMSLFYVHKRLSPNNIPIFRSISYDGNGDDKIMSSIKWLTLVQNGSITPYGWLLLSDEEDPEYEAPLDLLGNDPSIGIMWGNEKSAGMNDYFYHYNDLRDPNLIIKIDEDEDE